MAVITSRTLEAIRLAIGRTLGVVGTFTTTSAGGAATSVVCTRLRGGDNDHRGKWVRATSGTNLDETVQQVTAFASSTGTLTTDAFAATIPDAMTFELWDEDMHPDNVDDHILRAINMAARNGPDLVSYAVASSTQVSRYALPSAFVALRKVEYRNSAAQKTIHTSGEAFDETVDDDITVTQDTDDYRWGTPSVKFVVDASVSAGDTASDSIASVDLRGMTHVEFWAKALTATAASDLVLQLSETAGGATPIEEMAFPALTAETWTFVRLTIDDPQDANAVISVALEYNANAGANTIWLNHIRAVRDLSGQFTEIPQAYWRLERNNDELIFFPEAKAMAGNALLRLTGTQAPTQLTADASTADIDPEYIIEMATGMAYAQRADRRGARIDSSLRLAQYHRGLAEAKLARMGSAPAGTRWLS